MDAEAWAAGIGLRVLADQDWRPRRARIAGDSVPAVRYGAAQGRLRRIQAALDDGLQAALVLRADDFLAAGSEHNPLRMFLG